MSNISAGAIYIIYPDIDQCASHRDTDTEPSYSREAS
jgi:hypothetical protein